MDDQKFLEQFEAGTWPLEQWHHREHIKVAYLYLCRCTFEKALEKMCANIRAYNAAHQVPEGPGRGYHETMTHAWMRLVHVTLREFGPSATADAFLEKHTQLLSSRALLFFYSRDHIMSAEAKQQFVPPDLTALPQIRAGA